MPMAELLVRLRNPQTYLFKPQPASPLTVDTRLIGGGASGGNGSALFVGGGGGGGAYAATPNVSIDPALEYLVDVARPPLAAGAAGNASAFQLAGVNNYHDRGRLVTRKGGELSGDAAPLTVAFAMTPSGGPVQLVGVVGVMRDGVETPPVQCALPQGLLSGDVIVAVCLTYSTQSNPPAGFSKVGANGNGMVARRTVQSSAESGTVPNWGSESGWVNSLSYTVFRNANIVTDSKFEPVFTETRSTTLTFPVSQYYQSPTKMLYTGVYPMGGSIPNYEMEVPQAEATYNFNLNSGRVNFQAIVPVYPEATNVIVRAAAGSPGQNAGGLSGGTAGAGGTVANSTGTTRIAGGSGSGGTGGAGAASGTTPTGGASAASNAVGNPPGGGGGGGAILSGAGRVGARGEALLRFTTADVATTGHSAKLVRLSNTSRVMAASVTHGASLARDVVLRRTFATALTSAGSVTKQQRRERLATTTQIASPPRRAIAMARTGVTAHQPSIRKALVLTTRAASIALTAGFARAVTVRRAFSAGTSAVPKLFLGLEARLIPREGGTGPTTVIRPTFIFDD